jgi:ankyrin repeat protein
LKSLPRTLDGTYERILLNINEEYHNDAIKVLQWLAFSARPVTLAEVAEALAVDFTNTIPQFDPDQRMPDPRDILFICSSLVSTSSPIVSMSRTGHDTNGGHTDDQREFILETEELRLAHFSVKEYLIGERIQNSLASQYGFNGKIANRHIAQTCLAYLFQFDKMDSLQLQSPTYFPLAHYGAEFWMTHCKSQSEDTQIPNTIQQMIVHLLQPQSPQFVNWIRLFDVDKPWDRNQLEFSQELIPSSLYYTSLMGLEEASWDLVLEKGADVNAQGGEYGNALQAASKAGHQPIVQLLLEKGADVNAQGGYFGNALQAASEAGHQAIVQLLLEKEADVNVQGGDSGNALQAASGVGHQEIVQLLLEKGAVVNAQGGYFGNALQAASRAGHHTIVQLLLENGADVNAQGGECGNALQAALGVGHRAIVELLVKNGADYVT